MDYLCANFGDFIYSRFDLIVRTDRITEADQCYSLYSRDNRRHA